MKIIIIVCEGETEQEFCRDILLPYFGSMGILIQYPLIKKTSGGIGKWDSLKHHLEKHLKQNPSAFVTTLIDYYGIHPNHNFPGWERIHAIEDKVIRLEQLEQAMKQDLDPSLQNRCFPYLQLHEFEALLFSDVTVFATNFSPEEADLVSLERICADFENPEDINNDRQTAPSKRLIRHIKGYDKIVHGSLLADAIGLDKIRSRCSRFNHWLDQLENPS